MKYDFPKIDLHLHLDGSMLPDSAWEMAEERGVKMPADNPEDFKKIYSCYSRLQGRKRVFGKI